MRRAGDAAQGRVVGLHLMRDEDGAEGGGDSEEDGDGAEAPGVLLCLDVEIRASNRVGAGELRTVLQRARRRLPSETRIRSIGLARVYSGLEGERAEGRAGGRAGRRKGGKRGRCALVMISSSGRSSVSSRPPPPLSYIACGGACIIWSNGELYFCASCVWVCGREDEVQGQARVRVHARGQLGQRAVRTGQSCCGEGRRRPW